MKRTLLISLLLAGVCCAAESPLQLKMRSYFADREIVIPRSRHGHDQRMTVQIYYESRCVVRQEVAPGKDLRFRFPKLRPGLVAEAKLVSNLFGPKAEVETVFEKVYFYSNRPFADHQQILTDKQIEVYGKDADLLVGKLTRFGLPCRKLQSLQDGHGQWVICSGPPLGDDLAEALIGLVRQGTNVLVLPPSKGKLVLPWSEIKQISSGGNELIRVIDPRLDAGNWSAKRPLAAARFSFEPAASQVGLRCGNRGNWTWFSCHFSKARLIFCGWDLIGHLDSHPGPMRILERLILDDFTSKPQPRES